MFPNDIADGNKGIFNIMDGIMKLIKYIKYPTQENNNGWKRFDPKNYPDTDKQIIIITKNGEILSGQICLLNKKEGSYFNDYITAFYSREDGYLHREDEKIDCDILSIYPLDFIAHWMYDENK